MLALGLLVGCTFAPTLKVFAGEDIIDRIIAYLIVVCSDAMLDSIFCVNNSNFQKIARFSPSTVQHLKSLYDQ